MLKKIFSLAISIVIVVTGLILTDYIMPHVSEYLGYDLHDSGIFGVPFSTIMLVLFGLLFFGWLALVLPPFITNYIFNYSEKLSAGLSRIPTSDILVMILGIAIALILANLLGGAFSRLPIVGPYIPIILSLVLSVVGAKLALRKHGDIVSFFNRMQFLKSGKSAEHAHKSSSDAANNPALTDRLYSVNKLLDTSVIIDGRLMDIMAAGFLEGFLIVPEFVLEELQKLSDSADSMKRAKGRRGLDLVQDMQISYKNRIVIAYNDYDDITEVDAKLVRLAKEISAAIITNDFNLNKVAGIQGIQVLNINDLANAIKPVVISGEELAVYLVKEGKEPGQAVAYLDDGTMIVVENGRQHIGSSVEVIVTSVLQTSAGRMIFARMGS